MDDYRNSPTIKFCADFIFPAHRCPSAIKFKTRRCGGVHLGVVVLSVCEVCYVCEGYVGSAVVLCI